MTFAFPFALSQTQSWGDNITSGHPQLGWFLVPGVPAAQSPSPLTPGQEGACEGLEEAPSGAISGLLSQLRGFLIIP